MSDHRFDLGETVAASEFGVPPGPYRITRLLPPSDGVPRYRVKSVVDAHERAFSERAIQLIKNRAAAPPSRTKRSRASGNPG
jgi:hypothetical protein